jgi:hypothetical protein
LLSFDGDPSSPGGRARLSKHAGLLKPRLILCIVVVHIHFVNPSTCDPAN